MSLLFIDSFDHYVTADVAEKWTTISSSGGGVVPTINATGGRRGSGSFRLSVQLGSGNTAQASVTKNIFGATDATAVVGLAVAISNAATIGGTGIQLVSIRDTGTAQITLRLNSNLTLSVLRGAHNGTVLGTTTATLSGYGYLELKALIHASAGTVDLRLNGVSVLSLSAQNTRNTANTSWNAIAVGQIDFAGGTWSTSAAATVDFDDLYLLDGAGAAPWNTFLGDVRVDARYPTAEGANSAWTPLSGTDNALMVDETAPDDNTTYNSTGTVGAVDTHVVQDAPVAGATIYGVQHCLAMAKSDAGVCQIAPVIRHGSTDYVGAAIAPATTYAYGLQIAQVNPGTSAQWTEANFNAAEFGYKRTA